MKINKITGIIAAAIIIIAIGLVVYYFRNGIYSF